MIRLLLYIVEFLVVMLLWRSFGRALQHLFGGANPSAHGGRNSPRETGQPPGVTGQTARDPTCGMFVSTELSHRLRRGGETLHFCSPECLERYRKQTAEARKLNQHG